MKVLIISHVPITSYNNMGKTMASLFSKFEKRELCQLYVRPTVPNIDLCNSYYRITDNDLIKAIPFQCASGGKVLVDMDHTGKIEEEFNQNAFLNSDNRKPLRLILRDILWKISRWDNEEFWNWIDEEKVDVVFLAPGRGKFIYDVGTKVAQTKRIPMVIYICDEYYFLKPKASLMGKIHTKLLREKIRDTIEKATSLVTICDRLSSTYGREFKKTAYTIMTGSSIPQRYLDNIVHNVEHPTTISYYGNLSYKRYDALIDIGKELDCINSERNTSYRLKLYTPSADMEHYKACFDGIKSIEYCGFLIGEDYYNRFISSQILLHVESFDEYNSDLVKNSVSTKIADSLASGICLFAYGPSEVASIQHLISNDCAFVVTEKQQLRGKLLDCFNSERKRLRYANTALHVAMKYHNTEQNSNMLHELLETSIDNQGCSF